MNTSMLSRYHRHGISLLFKRCGRAAILAATLAVAATAQEQQPDPAASRPDRGTKPIGSYNLSDIENINLNNGNVSLAIPLASLSPMAGGKLSWTVAAHYNSKNWDVFTQENSPDLNHNNQFWTQQFIVDSPDGGWRIGGQYGIAQTVATDDFSPADPSCTGGLACLENSYNWKLSLLDPDGTRHELRPTDFANADASSIPWRVRFYNVTPATSGSAMRYYSFDGSYIWASIAPYSGAPFNWTVVLKDGTTIRQHAGVQKIIDPNGNTIKIYSETVNGVIRTHFQDLNATGSVTREVVVNYDATNPANVVGSVLYFGPTGVQETVAIQYGTTHIDQLFNLGDRNCTDVMSLISEDVPVVKSITLPQTDPAQTLAQHQFNFTYNTDATTDHPAEDTVNVMWHGSCTAPFTNQPTVSHGWASLGEMDMPSGAKVKYSFNLDGDSSPVRNFLGLREIAREHITLKKVLHDGTEDDWTYNIVPTGTGTVTGPDGSSTTETFYPHDLGLPQLNGDMDGRAGLVYRTNKSGVELIERHWTIPVFTGADAQAPKGMANFNPIVDAEYTSLLDGQGNPLKMSAKAYQIDYNGNTIDEKDYDWFDPSLVTRDSNGVPTAVPASATLLREVSNTYYNSPRGHAGSALVYAKRDLTTFSPQILNALQETTVTLGTTQYSDRQLSYDNNTFGTAPTAGNLTEDDRYDSHNAVFIKTLHSYDTFGNLLTTTDPNGNLTTYAYGDLTHALPTSITADPLNGTGAQVTNITYDYYTGLVTSKQDPAGNTTTTGYTNQLLGTPDPYGRLAVVTYPPVTSTVNGQSTLNVQRTVVTTYSDALLQVAVSGDLNANADGLLKTRHTTDQLGRAVLSETSEDGSTYSISAQTVYLAGGRIVLTSNPVRSASATTDGWTRTTKDTAGRVIEVATFSSAAQPPQTGTNTNWTGSVATSYSSNQTTVTDQAGNSRSSLVDGLGRLIQVNEDPNGVNYQTFYGYDPLGNLTSVSQGSQSRTFIYDSLSRLRQAFNPEQVNASGTQIATVYDYDNNGNLRSKQNPAGTTVTFLYDGLNRVTKKTLGGGPIWDYAYDTTTVGKGRLASITLDQTSGSQLQGDGYLYDSYDALARPTRGHQVTLGTSYPF